MSRSGRKRASKWDLKEPQLFQRGAQYDTWPRKAGEAVHNDESQSRRNSSQLADTDLELYGVESVNKDNNDFSDVMLAWHGDGSYDTKMSPGLDDWRQQKQSGSPRNGWGRSYRSRSSSQSRSPPYGFKRGSGLGGNTASQTCTDYFASGRCRRGDHCPYLHQNSECHEDMRCPESLRDSWQNTNRRDGASKYSYSECSDFIKGKGCEGATCKYVHNGVASDKGSEKVVFRERENHGSKYALIETSRDHEFHRTGDILCKFFAAGNCRKGKLCRFSHHGQTVNPNGRSHDDWRRKSSNLDTVERQREHLRLNDTTISVNAKLFEWNAGRNGNVGAHEQRDAVSSRDDRWVHSLATEKKSFGYPTNNDKKATDGNGREYSQPKAETADGTGGFESKGAENWFDDMEISSPWNSAQSSVHVVKEETGYISQTSQSLSLNETSLHAYERDVTGELLGQKHQVTAATVPLLSQNTCFQTNPSSREDAGYVFGPEVRKATSDCAMSSIDQQLSANVLLGQRLYQNGQSSSLVTHPLPSFNAVGQNQQAFPLYAPRENISNAQNQPLFQDKSFTQQKVEDANKSELTSEIPLTQNIVSSEQLSALALLLGNVQQLSNLAAIPNLPKSMQFVSTSLSNSVGLVNPLSVASIRPNLVIGSERQYDPLSDSIELIKHHVDNPHPGLLPKPVDGKVVEGEKPEVPSRDLLTSLTGGDHCEMANLEVKLDQESHQLDQLNHVSDSDGKGNNGMKVEESKKVQGKEPMEKMNGDGKADEGKKKNDAKGIRAFKFALVEFVKEILKPKWKEGHINKESHKTIVKKVVDKVTGSIKGAYIPQSQEKIDDFLSSSKPKLTRLVEAYAEKFQKN